MGSDHSRTSVQVLGGGGGGGGGSSKTAKAFKDKDEGKPMFKKRGPMVDDDKENAPSSTRPKPPKKENTLVIECESIDSYQT